MAFINESSLGYKTGESCTYTYVAIMICMIQ